MNEKSRFFQSRTKEKNGAAVELLSAGVPDRYRNQYAETGQYDGSVDQTALLPIVPLRVPLTIIDTALGGIFALSARYT